MMQQRANVLILPGLGNSGPEHWQTRWEQNDPQCQRVQQDEWDAPVRAEWVARLEQVMDAQTAPVTFAAHSSACLLVAFWTLQASADNLAKVRGGLLVAPSDPYGPAYPAEPSGFAPAPLNQLPFASIVVASSDDIYITASRAQEYATAWGSQFVLLENAGHINAASNIGAWEAGKALLDTLR